MKLAPILPFLPSTLSRKTQIEMNRISNQIKTKMQTKCKTLTFKAIHLRRKKGSMEERDRVSKMKWDCGCAVHIGHIGEWESMLDDIKRLEWKLLCNCNFIAPIWKTIVMCRILCQNLCTTICSTHFNKLLNDRNFACGFCISVWWKMHAKSNIWCATVAGPFECVIVGWIYIQTLSKLIYFPHHRRRLSLDFVISSSRAYVVCNTLAILLSVCAAMHTRQRCDVSLSLCVFCVLCTFLNLIWTASTPACKICNMHSNHR